MITASQRRSNASLFIQQQADGKSLSDVSQNLKIEGRSLSDVSENLRDVRSVLTSPRTPPPLKFSAPGVSVAALDSSWIVAFDGDAFDDRGMMMPDAKTHIKDLAKSLTTSGRNWKIEVITFPFPAGLDRPLARLRAERIANYLEDSCQLSPAAIYARIGSDRELKSASYGGMWRDPSRLLLFRMSAANETDALQPPLPALAVPASSATR